METIGSRAYPPDLARYVAAHWPAATPLVLPVAVLDSALAAAFHASLTAEEARPTRFRLLLTRPDSLPDDGEPNRGVLRLKLDRDRPLHADELRRLAPAAPFETSLIGAQSDGAVLRIWGIAHSGPAWLAPAVGGRSGVPNWTYDPIIHVTGPGHISVRCAGKLIGALVRGVLIDTVMDVFDSEWLPAMFLREREEVRSDHASLQVGKPSPTAVEHGLVSRISQHMIRRCVQIVRAAGHGGMILVQDVSIGETSTGLRVKYRFDQDAPTKRYRTLILRLLAMLADSTTEPQVGWPDFAMSASADLERLEHAIFEWSRVVANLAAVDGAVVLDKRFSLLGFGAEVSPELALPSQVWRALDTEAGQRRREDIEAVGTRHRAAYRFVNDHPGALAIVISHDGGVSFVAKRDSEVVFWEQSVSP